MSASPVPTWSPPPAPQRWGPGRVVALVLGVLLLLPGLGLLLGGAVLLWGDRVGRTDDGYLMAPSASVSAPGYALVSDRIDLSTGGDWVPVSAALGTTRVQATGSGPALFLGIGPSAQVAAYLGGVQRTVIDDLGADSTLDTSERPGAAPAGPPGAQPFWVAQTDGTGRQQLSWEPADGNWTVVVMNADGSAGVSADLRVGAELPALTGIAWGLLVGGLLLTAVAVLVIWLAARTRRPPAQGPAPGQPQPAWQPPAPRASPAGDQLQTPPGAGPAERG